MSQSQSKRIKLDDISVSQVGDLFNEFEEDIGDADDLRPSQIGDLFTEFDEVVTEEELLDTAFCYQDDNDHLKTFQDS